MKILLNGKETDKVSLKYNNLSAGIAVTPTLHLSEEEKIDKIEFVFDLPRKNIIAFSNGFCTNDFVEVKKLTDEFMCRDIVLFKGDDGVFSCGMLTGKKFLTRFFAKPYSLTLSVELEGKDFCGDVELEAFVFSDTVTGGDFFSAYCDNLAGLHNISLPKHIDTGWSSWSYYYRTVTENDCREQEQALRKHFPNADLVQIDDGWQVGDTFSAEWVQNGEAFKTLEKPMGTSRLGLWMSPTLADNRSFIFKNKHDMILQKDGTDVRSCGGNLIQVPEDGSTFPLDIGKEYVREHIADTVKNVQDAYNCHYFKLDFLVRSLLVQSYKNDTVVSYEGGNNIELYQKTTRLIREKVGKDTFMMACGAPITESVGVFDGIRTSPDITWVMSKNHVGFWYILKRDTQNIFLRSFYHNKVFICDSDALIARNHMSHGKDDFMPTLEEARVWVSTVGLSGGTVLINEDINALEEDRLELIKQVMEPIGIAALPDDMFELPYCSHVTLTVGERCIKGIFNLEEEAKKETVKNSNDVLAFDCWSKEYLGRFDGDIALGELKPHSCRVILLVPADKTGFVASCDNLFMGINSENIASGWYFDGNEVTKR